MYPKQHVCVCVRYMNMELRCTCIVMCPKHPWSRFGVCYCCCTILNRSAQTPRLSMRIEIDMQIIYYLPCGITMWVRLMMASLPAQLSCGPHAYRCLKM